MVGDASASLRPPPGPPVSYPCVSTSGCGHPLCCPPGLLPGDEPNRGPKIDQLLPEGLATLSVLAEGHWCGRGVGSHLLWLLGPAVGRWAGSVGPAHSRGALQRARPPWGAAGCPGASNWRSRTLTPPHWVCRQRQVLLCIPSFVRLTKRVTPSNHWAEGWWQSGRAGSLPGLSLR